MSSQNTLSTSLLKSQEWFDTIKLKTIIDNYDKICVKYSTDKDYLKFLQSYFDRSMNGIQKVFYTIPSVLGFGRKYALNSMSLQSMKRIFRHTISNEFYQDIDMVNAHPVILSYLCKINNITCDRLNEYINNREEILKNTGLSRDLAKKKYITLMNSEDLPDNAELTEHMVLFSNEMKRLHSFFADKNPDDFNKVKQERIKKNKENNNHKAGYMNQLMCQVEDNILMCMYKYFGSPTDCVLCFDGIMIKKGDYDLDGCIKQVKLDIGIDIKLEIKPMDNIIDLSEYEPSKIKHIQLDVFNDIEYFRNKERHIEDFEIFIKGCVDRVLINCKIYYAVRYKKCTKIVSMKEFYETMGSMSCFIIDSKPIIINLSDPKAQSKLNKLPIEINEKTYKYINMGFGKNGAMKNIDNKLKQYYDLDYIPYLSTMKPYYEDDIYNVFVPYPFDNYDRTDMEIFIKSKFYNHYRNNFFREDGEFDHFMDAIADMIQDPSNIKGNAHLFYSPQGTGKGILGTFMKRLLGDTNVSIFSDSERYFTTNFNGDSTNKILKIFEELKTKGAAQKNADRLKAEITAENERIERKSQDAHEARNCARYWFFTNNETAICAEHDDRRFTMHKIACKNIGDDSYFKPIVNEVKDDNFIKSALNFFATRKYDEANIRKAYDTKYKTIEKINQLPQGIRFFIRYIEDTYTLDELKNNDTILVKTKSLNNAYSAWCDSEGVQYKASTFKTQLRHLGIDTTKRHQFDDGRAYSVKYRLFDLQTKIREYLKARNWLFDIEGNTLNINKTKTKKKVKQ